MNISALRARALLASAAAGILAGCGGVSQSQLAPRAPMAQPERERSWMLPGAASTALLYVALYERNEVTVYSYPGLKLEGRLTGLQLPQDLCTDKKGDVFVVNSYPSGVVEYQHGGTKPIATLDDSGQYAVSCGVDPVTGDLAVTNFHTYFSGPGSVAIYARAKGEPTLYSDSKMPYVFFCGYDANGNLYVDGQQRSGSGSFQLAEIAKGQKSFVNIKLQGSSILFPGAVRWDGTYVDVGDQQYQVVGTHWDSAIFRTTGSGGEIAGVVPLTGSNDVVGFTIGGTTLVGADDGLGHVALYKYPAGGKPTGLIKDLETPTGVAISE
ncbi:MAG: hypothetical protein WA814_01875 [Candidatus Baltobacteraceae bacterium]